jgi:hypothetical protein
LEVQDGQRHRSEHYGDLLIAPRDDPHKLLICARIWP